MIEITRQQLSKLFWEFQKDMDKNENIEFKIKEMAGVYNYIPVLFHYCFAKGRISENELLEMIKK